MPARQKAPDGAEPLIIQEGGEILALTTSPLTSQGMRKNDLRK